MSRRTIHGYKKGAILFLILMIPTLIFHLSTKSTLDSLHPPAENISSNDHLQVRGGGGGGGSTRSKVAPASMDDQSMRLCAENPFAQYLNLPLAQYGEAMDKWIANKVDIEKDLVSLTRDHAYTHQRFNAFEVMGGCSETDCIGGPCGSDVSKIACGAVAALQAPCVVYSIGGNNQWEFEMDVLDKTPCEVHTFDCTGNVERFVVPQDPRLHFHHICLGTENKKVDTNEFWTLEKMTQTLNHDKIDLFKVDIEGYEFPLLQHWSERTDKRYDTAVFPMQVMVEIHYKTQMTELSAGQYDWKFAPDMINLQEHLLKVGYATVVRDDNAFCNHCTEITLMRIRCPEPAEF